MAAESPLLGRVYVPRTLPRAELGLELTEVPLSGIAVADGELVGVAASVESRIVLLADGPGGLVGEPMEPINPVGGALCFDPSDGGVRMRENRLAGGARNAEAAEATRFGMVNVLFHVTAVAGRMNRLLRELGAQELPPVHCVVGAHCGSRLPGYGQDDADYRHGRGLPLQGAHYRLSSLTTGVPEPAPVRPGGEIHFGPGRHREPFAGRLSYLRNASHNPATIYHEYGHHLCRHTADFRLNAERRSAPQRNGKTGPEEGVCDFLAAVMLGTGRPYGWQRPARGALRDPAVFRPPVDADADPHEVGARWSTVFWRTRHLLLSRGLIDSGDDFDRAFLLALLAVGCIAPAHSDARSRSERAAVRAAPDTLVRCYLAALRELLGADAGGMAERQLEEHGPLAVADGEESVC